MLRCISGGCSPAPAIIQAPTQRLRVMTFNVNYGGDIHQSLRAIQQSQADIVALQETTPEWPMWTKRSLQSQYKYMHFFSASGAGGMGFLSRYPIISTKQLQPRHGGWFRGWRLDVRTPLGLIHFLNVHLRPPLGEDGRLSSIPLAYFATRKIRRKELQAHFHHIVPHPPQHRIRVCGTHRTAKKRSTPCLPMTVVLGDFNEDRQGLALRWLRKKRRMTSALEQFDRTSPTWEWPTPMWTFRARLDHLMISPQLRATSAKVLPAAGSDHFPLVATLALRAAR